SDHTLTLVALIAIGLSLLAIGFVVFAGGGGGSETTATLTGDEAVGALLGRIDRIEQAVRALNATDRTQRYQIEGSVRNVALLRYDAFEDVGGRLSFSCAMLDAHGDGVVLTSINGRQETRVYAKLVSGGRSSYNLSGEEEEAIRQALASPREAVGAAAKIEGTLVSAGSLRIDGQVKGQINADGDVTLSPQSQVEADIRAQNVSVAGRFKGALVVKGKAHLARGGRVDGNITSKTL